MGTRLTLGAYWKSRRESIEQCVDRLVAFMHGIRECDGVFAQWYHLGRSRKDALKRKVDIQSRQELLNLLDRGRHYTDVGRKLMEDLGFGIAIWNGGEPDKEAGLSIHCGAYPMVNLSNSVVLHFPEDLGELTDPAQTSQVVKLTATCWDPDWAGVFSRAVQESRDWKRKPFVDWIVYVSRGLRDIREVPPPSTVTQVDDLGSLIVVQPNPPPHLTRRTWRGFGVSKGSPSRKSSDSREWLGSRDQAGSPLYGPLAMILLLDRAVS